LGHAVCRPTVCNVSRGAVAKSSSAGSGPDLSVWRPWAGSLLGARVVGAGVVVCLEQRADNSVIYI